MNFKLGTELHGFTVESVDKIEKINQCVYQLKYKKNGASLVHLSNKDTNNAFGIGFLTCPQDSLDLVFVVQKNLPSSLALLVIGSRPYFRTSCALWFKKISRERSSIFFVF